MQASAAIMQPYFLPYLGYFQLMSAAEVFVVYDEIKYTKKGWINRNRYLKDAKDELFSIPLAKASDSALVCERTLAETWPKERTRTLARIDQAYRRAPYLSEAMPLIEKCFSSPATNLFQFILDSLVEVCSALNIKTEIRKSSALEPMGNSSGQERVISLCAAVGATHYINPIGGVELYQAPAFAAQGITLWFLQPRITPYSQLTSQFCENLSILDVLMFNGINKTREKLNEFELVRAK